MNADDVGYGTAWLRACKKPVSPLGERVAELVNWWVRGIYHLQDEVLKAEWDNEFYVRLALSAYPSLSTFDADYLTRLVVGAHDAGIRVSIRPINFTHLEFMFHPRVRGGDLYNRHPTILEAIRTMRRMKPYVDPIVAEVGRD